jgi:hypothetical protein
MIVVNGFEEIEDFICKFNYFAWEALTDEYDWRFQLSLESSGKNVYLIFLGRKISEVWLCQKGERFPLSMYDMKIISDKIKEMKNVVLLFPNMEKLVKESVLDNELSFLKIKDIVSKMNLEIYKSSGISNAFKVNSIVDSTAVEFLDEQIWFDEEDERLEDEDGDGNYNETLEHFLVRKVNEIKTNLAKINLDKFEY